MAVPTAFPNAFPQPQGEQKQKQRRLPQLRIKTGGCCPGLSGVMREALRGKILLVGLVGRRNLDRMAVSCFAFFVEVF